MINVLRQEILLPLLGESGYVSADCITPFQNNFNIQCCLFSSSGVLHFLVSLCCFPVWNYYRTNQRNCGRPDYKEEGPGQNLRRLPCFESKAFITSPTPFSSLHSYFLNEINLKAFLEFSWSHLIQLSVTPKKAIALLIMQGRFQAWYRHYIQSQKMGAVPVHDRLRSPAGLNCED